jgi:hypothetical protein
MSRQHPTSTAVRKGFEKTDYWSMAEAARITGLAVGTLYKHSRQGRFTVIKTPGPYKCYAPSVREYYQNGRVNAAKAPKDLFSSIEK